MMLGLGKGSVVVFFLEEGRLTKSSGGAWLINNSISFDPIVWAFVVPLTSANTVASKSIRKDILLDRERAIMRMVHTHIS